MVEVKIYSLEGCGDTPPTIELLQKTAEEMDLLIELSHIKISSSEEADHYKFPGSPTVRVNGLDIEPAMPSTINFGLT